MKVPLRKKKKLIDKLQMVIDIIFDREQDLEKSNMWTDKISQLISAKKTLFKNSEYSIADFWN